MKETNGNKNGEDKRKRCIDATILGRSIDDALLVRAYLRETCEKLAFKLVRKTNCSLASCLRVARHEEERKKNKVACAHDLNCTT